MQPPEARRLKQLEDENSKLKKVVADLSLDREMLQDGRWRFAMNGACRSGGPAASWNSIVRPTGQKIHVLTVVDTFACA
jgi:hypothetical protein